MPAAALSTVFDSLLNIPVPARALAARLLGFRQANQLCASVCPGTGRALPERLLNELAITFRTGEHDLERIPATGPVIVVANHPFGILDGAVLATVLNRVRADVRFLGNRLLAQIPEARGLLIDVDLNGGSNLSALRHAIDFLRSGGCLAVFPAGEVSRYRLREGRVADAPWHTAVARSAAV